ncbi:flavodoxin family protein [Bacillota bacterium LX-D]|nr:flavodoxin family protein [Bacillota bacterium LX-D]
MKVIGFNGSPRKYGSTNLLIEQVLQGAKEKGAETKIYNLNDLSIKGCQSCYYCKEHETCVIKDDMQTLYSEILDADAIVLGTPLYMWQMSSQTKAFTDRLCAFLGTDFSSKAKGKKMVLVFTQGNPDPNIFQQYYESTAKMYKFLGFNVVDTILSYGNRTPDDTKGQTELLEKAKVAGSYLVSYAS